MSLVAQQQKMSQAAHAATQESLAQLAEKLSKSAEQEEELAWRYSLCIKQNMHNAEVARVANERALIGDPHIFPSAHERVAIPPSATAATSPAAEPTADVPPSRSSDNPAGAPASATVASGTHAQSGNFISWTVCFIMLVSDPVVTTSTLTALANRRDALLPVPSASHSHRSQKEYAMIFEAKPITSGKFRYLEVNMAS